MVSGSISPPCSGYFSPFPHGTGSLSVSQKYLALPDGAGRFRRDFSGPALLRILPGSAPLSIRDYHPLWLTFPGISGSLTHPTWQSFNLQAAVTTWIWAPPRSLATTWGITGLFSSPPGTKMFQFPGFAPSPCGGVSRLHRDGLPHSDIRGSIRICRSPRLFAAYYVLLLL